jgi:hypothetical protein
VERSCEVLSRERERTEERAYGWSERERVHDSSEHVFVFEMENDGNPIESFQIVSPSTAQQRRNTSMTSITGQVMVVVPQRSAPT